MANFDEIYADIEEDENARPSDETIVKYLPDPVVIRGAGNVTM
jgi:hypothetical protein